VAEAIPGPRLAQFELTGLKWEDRYERFHEIYDPSSFPRLEQAYSTTCVDAHPGTTEPPRARVGDIISYHTLMPILTIQTVERMGSQYVTWNETFLPCECRRSREGGGVRGNMRSCGPVIDVGADCSGRKRIDFRWT
jgi:hypothetical protein